MPDLLDETARQVRLPAGVVHRMVARTFDDRDGLIYRAACGDRLTGRQQAMLTTRAATCSRCTGVRPAALRQRDLVEAVLGRGLGSDRA